MKTNEIIEQIIKLSYVDIIRIKNYCDKELDKRMLGNVSKTETKKNQRN